MRLILISIVIVWELAMTVKKKKYLEKKTREMAKR